MSCFRLARLGVLYFHLSHINEANHRELVLWMGDKSRMDKVLCKSEKAKALCGFESSDA